MKIAIIGAGFSGAALSYYLHEQGHDVTLFDQKGLGGGASGVAAGLLHPYVGFEAKKNWRADEGMAKTKELLQISSETLGEPVFAESGIERIPVNERQKEAFAAALVYSDILPTERGILITSGILVNCKKYLEGIVRGKIVIQKIDQKPEGFDHVIVAAGYGTGPLTGETLHPMKGQIVRINSEPLSRPIISNTYRTPGGWVGATYERQFESEGPDVDVARRELGITEEILECQAGIRVFTPSKRPLATSEILTGMGSKGLLYHALFAQEIANSLC